METKDSRIDWTIVDSMLRSMCDGADIAARLEVSVGTLCRACHLEKNMFWHDYAESIWNETRQVLREQQTSRKLGYKREQSRESTLNYDIIEAQRLGLRKYAIYYRYNGQYYTYSSRMFYAHKRTAINWFRFLKRFDKIVAIYTIRLK